MDEIRFWKIYDREKKQPFPYGEFSNFYNAPFECEGVYYRTSEHFYQSKKFLDEKDQTDIINAKTPKEAADLGRAKTNLRKDWENIKDSVMRVAISYKFSSHPKLEELLLLTGDAQIIEDNPFDSYWACGPDGKGKNMLGRILMEYRDMLNNDRVCEIGG